MSRPDYWFYIDDNSAIQGPFPDEEMQGWFQEGYFTPQTLVRAAFFEDEKATDPTEFEAIINRDDFLDKITLERLRKELKSVGENQDGGISSSAPGSIDNTPTTTSSPSASLQPTSSSTQKDSSESTNKEPLPPTTHSGDIDIDLPPLAPQTFSLKHAARVESIVKQQVERKYRESDEWLYVDAQGISQGPFSTQLMRDWFADKYFDQTTKVKPSQSKDAMAGLYSKSSDFDYDQMQFIPVSEYKTPLPFLFPKKERPFPLDDKMWFYEMESGQLSGPWPSRQMRYWASKGFFTWKDTRVRVEGEATLQSISEHPRRDEILPIEGPTNEETWWVTMKEEGFGNTRWMKEAERLKYMERVGRIGADGRLGGGMPYQYIDTTGRSVGIDLRRDGNMTETIQGSEPHWLYLDASGRQQGPFPSDGMRTWFSRGLLPITTPVKEAGSEGPFTPIKDRDCCFTKPKEFTRESLPLAPSTTTLVTSSAPPPPPPPPSTVTTTTASPSYASTDAVTGT